MMSEIREVLRSKGRMWRDVEDVGDDDDLGDAGLLGHARVNVMLALEDRFDLEFPEGMQRAYVFRSISSIAGALDELLRSRVTRVDHADAR